MKKVNLLILCVLLSFGFVSCKVENDPVKISEAVIECINKGDFKSIKQFVGGKGNAEYYDTFQEIYDNPEAHKRESEKVKDLVDGEYTLDSSNVDENEAMIKYDYVVKSSGQKNSIKMRFERIDGTWFLIYLM